MPEQQLGRSRCVISVFTLFTVILCFPVLFHFCCSHAQVFGKTIVHEFHISYSNPELYLLSPLGENGHKICKQSAVKLNSKLTNYNNNV